MKRFFIVCFICQMTMLTLFTSCGSDSELLVTDQTEAYISSFQLRGPDNRNIIVNVTISPVDEDDPYADGTIAAQINHGFNLARLKPNCGTSPESTISPKMGVWTDFSQPVEYVVTSGDGQHQKKYTITVSERPF